MNWIDVVYVIIIVLFSVRGLMKGFMTQIVSIVSLIFAWIYSHYLFDYVRLVLEYISGNDTTYWIKYLVPIISFILIYAVSYSILLAIVKVLGLYKGILGFVNHLLGGVVMLFVSVTFLGLTSLAIDAMIQRFGTPNKGHDIRKESKLYYPIQQIVSSEINYMKSIP